MPSLEGKAIEYLDGNQLKIALVEYEAKSKLQVIDERGRNDSIAPSRVIILHRDRPMPGSFTNFARELRSRIEQTKEEIDVELLWQSIEASPREYRLEELAGVYFREVTSIHLSALFRALQDDNFYFRRKNATFMPRSAASIEELRLQLERRREREAFRERVVEWIRQVLSSEGQVDVPEDFEEVLNRTQDFLMRKPVGEIPQLLARANQELIGREAAFQLLVKTGRLSPDADPLLVISGIEERFRPRVLKAAEEVAPFEPAADRTDVRRTCSFSIDDEETREIDDALTIDWDGDRMTVGIHIADVSHFIPKGSALDEEALRRGVTVYLPTRTLAMFPDRLAFDLMSLTAGELRPTLSFIINLDSDGMVTDFEVVRGMIAVTRRLSYDEADRLIATHMGKTPSPSEGESPEELLALKLASLHALARRLAERRAQQGALVTRRPEVKVRVAGGQVWVRPIDSNAPSRMLVSEMMILANAMAARTAYTQDLAIIYRAQESALDPDDARIRQLSAAQVYDPLLFDRVMRNMRRSKLSLFPQPHAGLGLAAYTQLTSPIRRFADLVIQRQFAAHIQGLPLPYEREELLEVIATAEAAEREIRAIEQQSDRRWVYEYIKQQLMDQVLKGTLIDEAMRGWIVELDDLFVRGLMVSGRNRTPGARVLVVIESIDPEEGRLRLREADQALTET